MKTGKKTHKYSQLFIGQETQKFVVNRQDGKMGEKKIEKKQTVSLQC